MTLTMSYGGVEENETKYHFGCETPRNLNMTFSLNRNGGFTQGVAIMCAPFGCCFVFILSSVLTPCICYDYRQTPPPFSSQNPT